MYFNIIMGLAIVGFAISLYTYFIEQKIKIDTQYKPVCDLSDRISCSRPIKSEYSNIFFFSNAIAGMLFYALMFLLAWLGRINLLLISAIGSCIFSCILAYLLYFKVKAFCLLCTSLYIINFTILIILLLKLQ